MMEGFAAGPLRHLPEAPPVQLASEAAKFGALGEEPGQDVESEFVRATDYEAIARREP